jgi:monofunctional biosynthetic peptidoglycan transglycosylase
MKATQKKRLRKWLLKPIGYFFAITIGLVVVFRFVPVPLTITMLGQWVSGGELHYQWRSIDKINPDLAIAVVAAEDQLFPEHNGFDVKAIQKALKNNKAGKKVRGASTISQQTAKNVFLWQQQSWLRKGLEVYFTFLIETIWSKKRILEVYLNVAEFGPQTFGAQAASRQFFNTDANKLSRHQAARLAAVLPSPRKWKATNPGPYVTRRTGHIERQIRYLGGKYYLKDIGL